MIKKILVCSLFIIGFFLAEAAIAEPILSDTEGPVLQRQFTHQVKRVSGEYLLEQRSLLASPSEWQQLGKKIVHQIAGDDSRAYFGYQPKITVINNPLPIAAVTKKGNLVFSSGILGVIQSEDEFAFLIAHELAHEMLGHLNKNHAHHRWTLHEESSADATAVQILAEAGFRKDKGLGLLKRLESFGEDSGVRFEELYPTLRKRRSNLLQVLGKQPPQLKIFQIVSAG